MAPKSSVPYVRYDRTYGEIMIVACSREDTGLHLAGASRRNDTGRKLDAIDLSGQRYVDAYDRPISVLTPPLELTSMVACTFPLLYSFPFSVPPTVSVEVQVGLQTSPNFKTK